MSTKSKSLICNNFTGIRRVESNFTSSIITASDMQNVELFDTGVNSGVGIRTMKGNTSVLDMPDKSETIINMFYSVQNDETYYFLHTETSSVGRIYQYDMLSGDLSLQVDNLSVTGQSCGVDFAQGWSDLFLFSNGEEILSLQVVKNEDNTESVILKNFELKDVDSRDVKGLGLVVFDGRLWIYDGVVLWYSVKENCYDFSTEGVDITTSAGYIEFAKKVTAIYPYLGALAVFHKDSSSLIKIDSDYSYSQTDESPGGCASCNSLIFHGTELYFYDDTKKGVFSFAQVVNGDKTLGGNIAIDVQDELNDIDSAKLDKLKMLSVVQSEKNEIWFLIPSKDENYSTVLIFDYLHSCWVKRKSQRLNNICECNNEIYSMGENKLYQEYFGEDFDGEFINSYYHCSPLNLSADNTLKILYIPPRVTLDMSATNDFMVKYVKNYDTFKKAKIKHIKTRSFKNLFYWDNSSWDTEVIYLPKETNSIKKLPLSTFKTLEITFYTEDVTQCFSIKNIELSKIKVKQI
jgi:hypothetical protein